MQFVHHADLTCLAQAASFTAQQQQLERYTFPFAGTPGDDFSVKSAVKQAIQRALESRANRGTSTGRMHVELDLDNPGTGRVVDHIARIGDGVEGAVFSGPAGASSPSKGGGKAASPSSSTVFQVPVSLSKKQLGDMLANRGKCNSTRVMVGGQTFEEGTLRLQEIVASLDSSTGKYEGFASICDGDAGSERFDFPKLSKDVSFAANTATAKQSASEVKPKQQNVHEKSAPDNKATQAPPQAAPTPETQSEAK